MIDHLATNWILSPVADPRRAAGALAERVREVSIALYRYAAAVAERNGVIVADTKFEFGLGSVGGVVPLGPPEERTGEARVEGGIGWDSAGRIDTNLLLIDELLTPDSSRFWDAAAYAPGGPQASFDKQFVRDWLERQPWDKTAPGPELPPDVVAGTRARYVEAFERITGASFARYLEEDVIAP